MSIAQGIIYIADQQNIGIFEGTGTNLTGFGVTQSTYVTTAFAIGVGVKIGFQFQVASPPPILYINAATAADSFIILTPANTQVSLQQASSGAYYFQPAPDQKYNLVFTVGTAKAVGAFCVEIQSLVQNTLSQYLDIAKGVTLPKGTGSIEVRTTIALNTNSAIPNTLVYEFVNVPVNYGINLLAAVPVLANTNAVLTLSGHSVPTGYGMQSQSIVLVAGQNWNYTYMANQNGLFTGTIQITIQSVGNTVLVPSVYMTPSYDMGLFIEKQRDIMDGNFAGVMSSTTDLAIQDMVVSLDKKIESIMAMLTKQSYKSDMSLSERRLNRILN